MNFVRRDTRSNFIWNCNINVWWNTANHTRGSGGLRWRIRGANNSNVTILNCMSDVQPCTTASSFFLLLSILHNCTQVCRIFDVSYEYNRINSNIFCHMSIIAIYIVVCIVCWIWVIKLHVVFVCSCFDMRVRFSFFVVIKDTYIFYYSIKHKYI